MGENFFTSKQAAKIIGCSLRQLQYWREKEVIVPTIEGSGTGRSIYYSRSDLVQLAIMEYLLSVGLSFATASWALKQLVESDSDYANSETEKRWMLWWDDRFRSLILVEFDREKAIASLDKGKAIIPIWLDEIHLHLQNKILR
ncbi:MAG: MerR family transcriptional regulator [Prochloraceae cyanobacterium]|nr:MerR family transcriptional regulator [Prochloraceae cyanobacterium]